MRPLDKTLEISQWETPATSYPLVSVGTARFDRTPQTTGYYSYWGMDGYLYWHVRRRIQITELQLRENGRWSTWMVDDPPQWRAMQIFAEHATGRVLVAGLGLGLVCHELVRNPLVEHITVVERNADVITLMRSHTPEEVNIVHQDFYEFIYSNEEQWDTIIVDIWVSRSAEEKLRLFYQEVLHLHFALSDLHPNASISFHGFYTVSDVKVTTEEMAHEVIRNSMYREE